MEGRTWSNFDVVEKEGKHGRDEIDGISSCLVYYIGDDAIRTDITKALHIYSIGQVGMGLEMRWI